MDKQNITDPSPTIQATLSTDSKAAQALFIELELDAAHAEAVKGGTVGGSNANIQNHPHQLSLR